MSNNNDRVWEPDKPRFIVDKCDACSDDRRFIDGSVVYNQKLGMAYSVDEIVEVLNNNGLFSDYFNELIQVKIWCYQALYRKCNDEQFKVMESCLKELRDEVRNRNSIFKYSDFLRDEFLKRE